MSAPREVDYGSYLSLGKILDAQRPPGPDGAPRDRLHHDEMLFIVVHQVYELWFKQMLHELTLARDLLAAPVVPEPDIFRIVAAFDRMHEIEKVLVSQLGILETMSPLDFLAFRGALGSASGFQSAQFRELEILAGLPDEERIELGGNSFESRFPAADRERFARVRAAGSFRAALERWLERTPIEPGFPDRYREALDRYVDGQLQMHRANSQLSEEEKRAVVERLDRYRTEGRAFLGGEEAKLHCACLFLAAYREEPLLHWPNRLLDAVCEFEELFRLWRFRHARMVERMIGLRVGTGGSSGVDYLDATARGYRIFSWILQSRSYLVPRELLPDLDDPQRYGFAQDAR